MSRENDLSRVERAQSILDKYKGDGISSIEDRTNRIKVAKYVVNSHDPFGHPLSWSEAVSMKVLKNTAFLSVVVPVRVILDVCGTTIEGCQFLIDRLPRSIHFGVLKEKTLGPFLKIS